MAVDINGLFYTMNKRGQDISKLLVLYDFQESGQILNKAQNYSGQFSGLLSGPSDFYYASGTGYPTTNIVSVQNNGNFFTGNWTQLFIISRSGSANDNFFSSLAAESGAISSGYLITSNNAGNLVFSYADCNGNQSVTSDLTLNINSAFAVTKRDDALTFYQYTPDFNILDSDTHQIVGSQIFKSDFADLFFANHAQPGFIKDYYSGYVSAYAYFTESLSAVQLIDVFSGLFTTITISGGSNSSGNSDCDGFFTLSSDAVEVPTTNPPPSVTLNRKGITLLREFKDGDQICIDYDTANSNSSWNNRGLYDFAKNNFTTYYPTTIPPIVYFNGQRVVSGWSQITGQFCQTGKAWEFDYAFSGMEIDDADSYSDDDGITYDIPGQHRWQELHSGTGSVILSDTAKAIGYYLNGQRIKDFTISGSTLIPNAPLTSGDIVIIDYFSAGYGVIGEIHNSGYLFTSGNFAQNTSRVYFNGQRQILGVDYLEITDGSLIQGAPLNVPSVIVNNIDNFLVWNL
jgi:hypothetical protein